MSAEGEIRNVDGSGGGKSRKNAAPEWPARNPSEGPVDWCSAGIGGAKTRSRGSRDRVDDGNSGPKQHRQSVSRTTLNRADSTTETLITMGDSREKYEPNENRPTTQFLACAVGWGVLQVVSMAETKGTTAPKTGKPLACRCSLLSPFESTKADSHRNPFVNDTKINLVGRRSIARCLADSVMVEREEEGARRGGWRGGKGKKEKRTGWLRSSGQGGRLLVLRVLLASRGGSRWER